MFKWKYTEVVETKATSNQIWSMWQDAESWPSWDSDLEWVKLSGPFVKGAKGSMKPKGSPVVKFKLTVVEKGKSFVDQASLPLTTMYFVHVYEQLPNGGAQIIHTVEMRGLLAPIFGRVIGNKIRVHLRTAMITLSNMAASR